MTSIMCPICMQSVTCPVYSRSRHVACKECIDRWYTSAIESGIRPLSPNTRAPMDQTYYGPLYVTAAEADTDVEFTGKGHIVLLLDCSGSMANNSKDCAEASPSRISMMIHMVKMLAMIFNKYGYYISIMQFNSECSCLINKAEIVPIQIIESLKADSGTDMVNALATSVSLHGLDPTYIMFTDGEPNQGTEAITARIAKSFGVGFKLHVVGFGPSLNDDVMSSLANTGNGTYTYIFDINTSSVMMSSLVAYIIAPDAVMALEDANIHKSFITCLSTIHQSNFSINDLLSLLKSLPQTAYCQALQDDVEHRDIELGQISKAIRKNASWGKYYLSAILRAHQQKYTMSDIEKSLQFYASGEFIRIRTESMVSLKDTVFKPVTRSDVTHIYAVTQAIATSTGFQDTRGGCFSGNTPISMHINNIDEPLFKNIKDLRKGDTVLSMDKTGTKLIGLVDCIIAYHTDEPVPMYENFITAYHPVYVRGQWQFPCNIMVQGNMVESCIYNILLRPGACCVFVGDVPCITLGHDITEDVVARHPYFGSNLVRDEIMRQSGYDIGLVGTTSKQTKRDGLIYSMF